MNVIVVCVMTVARSEAGRDTFYCTYITENFTVLLKKSPGYQRRAPSVYLPGRDRRGFHTFVILRQN